ncbi:MAG TPA: hypothetical protein PLD20_03350 [Blastocatellia bacterium]|nr:hypothetical protein [Blastocatellia bacterium]HMV82033.1 hypothetical protein [Blastocatellia bacterium]HMX24035.1 hypothetical protein [Blastocatellia bacterium]HMY72770.1 hypothetical protein [Blastocatellia bacterium]HMZ16938.1 hypothetical protein [Blastocatellia bacterium]
MTWENFDKGQLIGTRGSEQGIILRDEEHSDGARITLERDGYSAPFSITSGIYGWIVHTSFFSTQQDAQTAFEEMKAELSEILHAIPNENDPDLKCKQEKLSEKMSDFVIRH